MSADMLYSYLFDFKNASRFARLFDKATHLVTGDPDIRTESYDLNFIFKDPRQNDVYETCYQVISYVMLCIHLMQIELLKRIHFVADYYLMQVNMRAVGTYEALFIKGRSAITHGMRKLFGELMKCPACNERIQLRKKQSQCS